MYYSKPTITVSVFDAEDLIVASGGGIEAFAPGGTEGQNGLTATVSANDIEDGGNTPLAFK